MKREPDKSEKTKNERRQQRKKDIFIGIIILSITLIGFFFFRSQSLTAISNQPAALTYSEFKDKIKSGQIVEATISTSRITGEMKNAKTGPGEAATLPFVTTLIPTGDPNLVEELEAAGVKYSAQLTPYPMSQYFLSLLMPVALVAGFCY